MLHAGEIRLGREGEQVRRPAIRCRQPLLEMRTVDAKLGDGERRVLDRRAAGACELANPVHRVVVVDGQQVPAVRPERVRFADQLERSARVQREDGGVLLARRIEVGQDRPPRLLHQPGRRRRAEAGRVRVAEDVLTKQGRVVLHLRRGIQAAARVIKVDVLLGVEPTVLGRAQRVERGRFGIRGCRSRNTALRFITYRITIVTRLPSLSQEVDLVGAGP